MPCILNLYLPIYSQVVEKKERLDVYGGQKERDHWREGEKGTRKIRKKERERGEKGGVGRSGAKDIAIERERGERLF